MEDLDRQILGFLGAHRFVAVDQVQRFANLDRTAAIARLDALEDEEFVRLERPGSGPEGIVRVTAAGLDAIGSRLPAPGVDLARVRHEIAVVWWWLAAWQGEFGEAARVLSRREMELLDSTARDSGSGERRFALAVEGPEGRRRATYPDLMMVPRSSRMAGHLLLWPYRGFSSEVLAAYRDRPVADAVLILVDQPGVAAEIQRVAERLGIADLVHVRSSAQMVRRLGSPARR